MKHTRRSLFGMLAAPAVAAVLPRGSSGSGRGRLVVAAGDGRSAAVEWDKSAWEIWSLSMSVSVDAVDICASYRSGRRASMWFRFTGGLLAPGDRAEVAGGLWVERIS